MTAETKETTGSDDDFQILLIQKSQDGGLGPLAAGLATHAGVTVYHAESAVQAREVLAALQIDALVADQELADLDGLAFVREVSASRPFINTVLLSELNAEDFHETTEGLGVLMQIPVGSGAEMAGELVTRLSKIRKLVGG
jgi:CheY-like chemotaxis protein